MQFRQSKYDLQWMADHAHLHSEQLMARTGVADDTATLDGS